MNKYYDASKYTKKELIDFLVENKKTIIAQKKAQTKHADGIATIYLDSNTDVIKDNVSFNPESGEIKVKVVINTTNIMDSHDDVHLNGIWDKSLKINKTLMHLQEHNMTFDKIIADGEDLKAYVKELNWKDLGFNYKGSTQAFIFDSKIRKSRNEYMFDQYAKGFVKNHSVGMQYVQVKLAVNDEDREDEYKTWKAHINDIANKELAEEKGFFWAVREAKAIEGSAVPLGSNPATPTLDNNMKSQQSKDTDKEQSKDTLSYVEARKLFNILK